jgi:hypothetical protein
VSDISDVDCIVKVNEMKFYNVIELRSWWSHDQLRKEVESLINEKARQGYEIVSVSFCTTSIIYQCFITICK